MVHNNMTAGCHPFLIVVCCADEIAHSKSPWCFYRCTLCDDQTRRYSYSPLHFTVRCLIVFLSCIACLSILLHGVFVVCLLLAVEHGQTVLQAVAGKTSAYLNDVACSTSPGAVVLSREHWCSCGGEGLSRHTVCIFGGLAIAGLVMCCD